MSIGCGGCSATWTGLTLAHCAGCHETFSSVIQFDHHRVKGKCIPPEKLGMVKGGRGVGNHWVLRTVENASTDGEVPLP